MADGRPKNKPGRFSERFIRLKSLVKATRKGNISEVRDLVKAGVSVNCTAGGVTALHVAAAHDHVECAEFLLENKGNVNQTISDLITPLHVAVRFESLACVILFTNSGADVNAANKEGWSPLHLASRNGSAKSAEVLIYNGAEVEAPVKPRNSRADELYPLHFAARHGHANCIEVLLKHGANVNRQTGNSLMTALHFAMHHKHLDCAWVLLGYRADTLVSDYNGNQPLHIACKNGDNESVELLLQAGASTDYFNNTGKRPIDVANNRSVKQILKPLMGMPKCLMFLCIQVIRNSLCGQGTAKSLKELTVGLPVPSTIRNMLALNTEVEITKSNETVEDVKNE